MRRERKVREDLGSEGSPNGIGCEREKEHDRKRTEDLGKREIDWKQRALEKSCPKSHGRVAAIHQTSE